MKFWQVASFSETDQLLGIAQTAEEVGFEGVLLADHLFFPGKLESRYPYSTDGAPGFDGRTPFPDPWAVISAMAAVTTRLRFGTMVYILPLRHPVEVAKSVGTASLLSGGRLALGAGAGWIKEEFDVLGVDFRSRGSRMDEMIEAMRALWTGDMVSHQGTHFDLPEMQMSPAPEARIPIWIGGISPAALRRAARNDGWVGSGHTPGQAEELLDRIAAERAQLGRENEPFEAIVPLAVPPEADLLRRLEAKGATGTVNYPFALTLGGPSTLAQKQDAMRAFADGVIAKLG